MRSRLDILASLQRIQSTLLLPAGIKICGEMERKHGGPLCFWAQGPANLVLEGIAISLSYQSYYYPSGEHVQPYRQL